MSGGRRLKDGILERYLADSLDSQTRQNIDAVLEQSPEDRKRLSELRADSEAFLLQHPSHQLVARYRSVQRARLGFWISIAVAQVAVAAAAVFYVRTEEPEFSAKGDVALVLHRREGRVLQGDVVPLGDSLRFEVKAASPGQVALLTRGAEGEVQILYPNAGTTSAPYHPSQPLLPLAIQLEGPPGKEAFMAVFSPEPFELAPLLDTIRKGETVSPPLSAVIREVETR